MIGKICLSENVMDAAYRRIEWLFDEFENIVIDCSGGKDSTVIREIALDVAEKKNRLPIKVLWCDLEVEWQGVADYMSSVFDDKRIEPIWIQMPMRLFNAASENMPYLHVWNPDREWMRQKDPRSIKENVYGVDRIDDLLPIYLEYHYPEKKSCHIAGVRTDENASRRMGLTSYETYKGITWGNKKSNNNLHFSFYPIYDWSYSDIWKFIFDKGVKYCSIYDKMYQYGIGLQSMRISSVIHERAVKDLFFMQEIEPHTWSKISQIVSGVNTAGSMQKDFYRPKELPFMFYSWIEYRDYLLENLIIDSDRRGRLKKQFAQAERLFRPEIEKDLVSAEIDIILNHEDEMVKLQAFYAKHAGMLKNHGKQRN